MTPSHSPFIPPPIFAVNSFCLLDTLAQAYAAASAFGRDEPEPGPYVIFEVLRAANTIRRADNS